MKFSEQWLREWVNPSITTETLLEQLTNAGLEVDSATPVAAGFNKVVVAEIIAVNPHPNADRLKVCSVDIGDAEPIIIVTNVADIKVSQKVPAALVGATLPGLEIKQTALRGVDSFGMFCSAKTLGITDDDSGLLQLPSDAPNGQDIRKYLQLDDVIVDIELTPNRGDCLSIVGIAREVAVTNQCAVKAAELSAIQATIPDHIAITIQAPEACPRYVSRVMRNINSQATTPLWMQEKLRRSGIRSIHPVVDVTNYVMLELGQPMHAFDLAKLNGGVTVRYAEQDEKIILLDEQELSLNKGTLLITDEKHILALAGIMGGLHSGISAATQDIVLESAFFAPGKLLGKARQYGLHTDSSHRFERGVDPEFQVKAIERATELLIEIVGGDIGPIIEKISRQYLPVHAPIILRASRIKKLLGIEIAAERVQTMLQQLGMQIDNFSEGWKVIPPSHRFDITVEADLIEEVARIYGYNNIQNSLPLLPSNMLPQSTQEISVSELRQRLKNRGYHETVCYSFVEPELQELLDPGVSALPLSNPISSELSVMRTSLWASLLPVLLHNQKRQQARVRIFETGLRFVPTAESLQQIPTLAGLIWGSALPEQWGEKSRAVDFYDVKADVETLLKDKVLSFRATDLPALHPGRSAAIYLNDKVIGQMGALHPHIEQKLGVNGIYAFELDLAALTQTQLPHYKVISKFPMIRRDLALVLKDDVLSHDIYSTIVEVTGKLLNNMVIFDLYQGAGVPDGYKSIAIGIFLQAHDRTLIDDEVNNVIEKILTSLQERYSATIRSAN